MMTMTCSTPAASLSGPLADGPQPPAIRLSLSRPTWIVKTESNVWKEGKRKMSHPACIVCHGNGKVNCRHCHGRGRTNLIEQALLPKGEWPKWCRTCGGSGLDYCPRCLGTGEFRDVMGFHFMKKAPKQIPD